MGDEEKLKIIIEAHNKAQKAFDEANAQIDRTQKNFTSMGEKLDAAGEKMKTVGTKMTKFVTLPILAGAGLSIKAFSDLQETLNKVDVSFGKSSNEVKKWSETSIQKMGLAQQSALDAASLFGDMGTGMGQNQKDAAKMSMGLTQLGADMASFKNVSIDRAQTALAGVYTGETEALKSLGIVMTETNLQEYAASKGITKKLSAMSQAEKVQLRYNFVMDATKNAQGDFARTSDSIANKTRTAQEKTKQLSAELGGKLAPVYQKLLEVGTKVLDWFGKLSEGNKDLIVKAALVAAALGPVVRIMGSLITSVKGVHKAGKKTVETLGKIGDKATMAFIKAKQHGESAVATTKKLAEATKKFTKYQYDSIKMSAQYKAHLVKENALKAASAAKTIALTVAEKARLVVTKIGIAIQTAWNAVMALNPVILIVAAIAALVAALVYCYFHFETFRNIVDAVWNAIVVVVLWAWNNVIKPIWDAIVIFITNILVPTFQFLWGFLQGVWTGISTIISWAWGNVIKPIWDALVWVITNVLMPIFRVLWNTISWVWDKISAAISWAWENIIKPIWDGIVWFINNILIPIWDTLYGAIVKAWDWIWNKISTVVGWITEAVGGVVDWIQKAIDKLLELAGIKEKEKKNILNVGDEQEAKNRATIQKQVKNGTYIPPSMGQKTNAAGGWTEGGVGGLVGEKGPEIFVPSTSGQIIDAKRTAALMSQAMGTKSDGGFNMYGNIILSTQESVDRFFERVDRDGELASMGVPT